MCWIWGLAFGLVALGLLEVSGTSRSIQDTLGASGFDADRAALIAGLILMSIVVAASTLIVGRSTAALIPGAIAYALTFGQTFVSETQAALANAGPAVHFDAFGWVLTCAALLLAGLSIGTATIVLADAARRNLLGRAVELFAAVRYRQFSTRHLKAAAVLILAILSVALFPVFGDMVNYTPDARMVSGGQVSASDSVGLASAATDPHTTVHPSGGPNGVDIWPARGSSFPVGSSRPWLAWRSKGPGSLIAASLPAPWTGGRSTTSLSIYLPAGYADGSRTYSVVYEVPWGLGGWATGVHLIQQLDSLIASGAIPSEIVVLISEAGGPYIDSQCINSADGREPFETYVVSEVVPYVDAHYRTIANPAARALMGFSVGGYCAPMLLLRHTDVFSSSISFSGYFTAAIRSSATNNAYLPYGGDNALIRATSPIVEVAAVPQTERSRLFIELSADPANGFYGSQYLAFAAAVRGAGIALALFPSSTGHAWSAVRDELGQVLETLAERQVTTGVLR